MNVEQARRYIIEQVAKMDSSYEEFEVQFMGGEPLMEFPLIREVSEWLWQQNFQIPLVQIFISTNGTLLSESMKSWFSQNKERICMGLSFDGTRLMQNVNRCDSAAIVDLRYFASTWPRQSVKMTLSPATLPHLYSGVQFLYESGFNEIAVDLAMGKNVDWKQEHLSVLYQQLTQLEDFYLAHPSFSLISILDIDVLQPLRKNSQIKKCSCGEQLVCVDCDGQEYACHLFSPVAATREQAVASQQIEFSNYERFISDQCKPCLLASVCTMCYGMNYICNGSISEQFSFTCQAFKIQYLIACDLQRRRAEIRGDKTFVQQIDSVLEQFKN